MKNNRLDLGGKKKRKKKTNEKEKVNIKLHMLLYIIQYCGIWFLFLSLIDSFEKKVGLPLRWEKGKCNDNDDRCDKVRGFPIQPGRP